MGGDRLIPGCTALFAAMEEDIRFGPATMVFRGVLDVCPPLEPLAMLLPIVPMRDVRLVTLDTTLFASNVSETVSMPAWSFFAANENRIDADFLALAATAGGDGLW